MAPLFAALLTACTLGADPAGPPASYLYEPSFTMDDLLRGTPRAYVPQPGDVMVYTDSNMFWEITHDMALAFQPHGSGIVVRRPDGSLGILEAGPNDTMHVRILDTLPHLCEYESRGPVWIRVHKTPLTPEQDAQLTAWAMRQDGKRFAIGRLGEQVTVLRTRGPLRTFFVGKPNGDRSSYFCSELVTETCVAAGLIDAKTARPSATYPHDLFFNYSFNLYINKHLPLACDWEPPARWVSCPAVPVGDRK